MTIEIIPVHGLPEVASGDEIAEQICSHASFVDGDVVVVAQKVVSKAEGRFADAADRDAVIAAESTRILARRGDVVIVRTRHGFVCANAGVDASNVSPGRLVLLPLDPDGSAAALREQILARTGAHVGVIISDTFGRPWRMGQTNVALGVAGLSPLRDHRGEKDSFGVELNATVIAVADEIAGAAELVMRKSDGVPVAIVRGIDGPLGEGTAQALIRPDPEDMFPTGGVETIERRRSVRTFTDAGVPEQVVVRAVEAAATAPAPHGSRVARPFRFVWLRSDAARGAFLDAMATRWEADLLDDGTDPETIARRRERSDSILRDAPVLIAAFVSLAGMDTYAEPRRARAEREMFIAAAGGAMQSLMVALAAQNIGSCWISSSIFCPDDAADALGLDGTWAALGCVAAGFVPSEQTPRPARPLGETLDIR